MANFKKSESRWKKIRSALLIYAVVCPMTLVTIVFFFWIFPNQQLSTARQFLEPKAVLEFQNEIRVGLAQAIGGALILFGLFLALRTILKYLKAKQQVLQGSMIVERLILANEQLSNDKILIRLGAIYSLEAIAKQSEREHWQIMELLTAYVRENAPSTGQQRSPQIEPSEGTTLKDYDQIQTSKVAADIQAILNVLGRRTQAHELGRDGRLDLHATNLRGASVRGGHFEGTDFRDADLGGADLCGSFLTGADFGNASLGKANLSESQLERARLVEAGLGGADLGWAHLENADLTRAQLQRAQLLGARLETACLEEAHLEEANLSLAHLEGARLTRARLQGAHLIRTHLEGADLAGAQLSSANISGASLTDAKGLTEMQLSEAIWLDEPTIPEQLKRTYEKLPMSIRQGLKY